MNLHDKLLEYSVSDFYPFHMPGHKRGLSPWELGNPYDIDITEIDGFDNLHDAEGIILEEERRAAGWYGTKESLFSVNGSTACLLAAVSAAVSRNGKILMARNCHKAVYNAVYLRGLEAVYLQPPVNKYQINLGIQPEDVEKALQIDNVKKELQSGYGEKGLQSGYGEKGLQSGYGEKELQPDAVEKALQADNAIEAVLITSPTYEGLVSDVEAIAEVAHRYGKPLIVDEAHGAHFGMHPYFPQSAVKLGADVVIQSLHKTLPSMTQTAILHRCSDRVSSKLLHRFMRIYQSSSPSYVLMGSITACLHTIWEHKEKVFEPYVEMLKRSRERLGRLENFTLLQHPGADPSKLVFLPKKEKISMTGEELYHILLERYHLQLEMALPNLALAMTSVGDTAEGFERLCQAMEEIDRENV